MANMNGHCLDCKAPTVCLTDQGEFTVVHSGNACDGFRRRFSVPGATRAMSEGGDVIARDNNKAKLPAGKEK